MYVLFVLILPRELVLIIIRMAFVVMTHVWRQRVVLLPLWAHQYAAPFPKEHGNSSKIKSLDVELVETMKERITKLPLHHSSR